MHICIVLIAFLPLFAHLDEVPIQVWDEMRNAQNALEMNKTGNIIVTTIDYKPEVWNTKPPFMIWVLALSQRILGYNELAVRLPSAIAGLLTCFLLLHFGKRRLGSWLPGIIAVVVLVSTRGYVTTHGTRTGDYDAMLTLFTTASVLWFVNFIEDEKHRWLYASAVMLVLAVLTKGIAGLLVCPAMLGYVLVRRKGSLLFKSRAFYYSALGFIVVVVGYYLLREFLQPGYWNMVLQNEIFGRYNSPAETHSGNFWIYFKVLGETEFVPWIWFVIPAALGGFFAKDIRHRHLALICALVAVSTLLILSCGQTKLAWYMLPVYPFLALLCGLLFYQVVQFLAHWEAPRNLWSPNFLPVLFVLVIATGPYLAIVDQSMKGLSARAEAGINDAGVYLSEVIAGERAIKGNTLCGDSYPLFWHRAAINEMGIDLGIARKDTLEPGSRVITWDEDTKSYIRSNFQAKEIENFRSVSIYYIVEKKLSTM